MPVDRRGATAGSAPRWRAPAAVVGALVILGSLAVLAISGVRTSSARIAATTEVEGLLSAGTVELTRTASTAALIFDADGLYAGATVTGCVEIRYAGDVPAALRLSAAPDGGTGLDAYIDLQVVELASETCPEDEDGATPSSSGPADLVDGDNELFFGRLSAFWQTHSDFVSGLVIADEIAAGDVVAIRASATVVDDNAAAGLDTVLSFTFESRPA